MHEGIIDWEIDSALTVAVSARLQQKVQRKYSVEIQKLSLRKNLAKPMQESELKSLVQFACSLADVAGETILPYFRRSIVIDNKLDNGDFDPVTVADRNAESAMRELIERHYPLHGIFGEEFGQTKSQCGLTWVLDPIDGTRAFISGLPVWGVLIALFDGAQPIIGIMDQPFTGERFIASGSKSVSVHRGVESVLKTRQCENLAAATMMSTAPDMFTESEFVVQQQLGKQVNLLRYGGDCYAYSMLASGHIDLVVESDLSAYDIQALIPIVQNAGGVVTDWLGGSAVNGGQVLAAATPALHAQALSVLRGAAKKSDTIL